MLNRLEMELEQAHERRRNDLASAEHDRLVAACMPAAGLSRWLARPLGRALFGLGARLLRYGNAETSIFPAYRPSARAGELN